MQKKSFFKKKPADEIEGVVQGHRDGHGFFVPDDGSADIYLPHNEMRAVLHRDRVRVRIAGFDRKGRPEGRVLEIIERSTQPIIGRLLQENGIWLVAPEDKRYGQDVLILKDAIASALPGQVVVVELTESPALYGQPVGRIKEVLGEVDDPGMEIEIAVRKYGVPHIFSDACLRQAKALPATVQAADWHERVDLTDIAFVTIDGEDARDFDDAVYCEPQGKGFRLVVAIADVSHYVQPDDAIDKDAVERTTSVYFPRRVIPMLPESLSNGICSLNPDVERLCMVCDMVITYAGNVKEYKFYPAVMRSHARLTYTQVWNWIEGGGDYPHKAQIEPLYKLFQILQKKRQQRGAMEFESIETQMLFDDNGKIERIVPVTRNDAHKLIEECMLAANVCAAEFLLKNKHTALFRNHLGPTPEKLATLREQLGLLGLHLGGGDKPSPKDYAALAEKIAGRPDQELLQVMLLRSMQQAVYEPNNEGHFGLAYEAYAHFTSPIRRYPDLTVHRAIKAVLNGEKYAPKSWQALGVTCSFNERRADDASRDVENWLKTYYMRDKVGEVFNGRVSGMANFGIFVTLDDIHIEGMVHISDLGEDYFNFRPEIMAMEGERSGVRFNMGDEVVVKVARADLDTSKIDLTLISGGLTGKSRKNAKQNSRDKTAAPAAKGKSKTAKQSDNRSEPRSNQAPAAKAKSGKPGKSLKMVDGKITFVQRNEQAGKPAAAAPAKQKGKAKTTSAPRKRNRKK